MVLIPKSIQYVHFCLILCTFFPTHQCKTCDNSSIYDIYLLYQKTTNVQKKHPKNETGLVGRNGG